MNGLRQKSFWIIFGGFSSLLLAIEFCVIGIFYTHSAKNQYNFLEEDLLYIFNPLEYRNFTYGLLSGISSADLMPCAYKCLVSLEKFDDMDKLKEKLLFAKNEINTWKKLNMMLIINGM